MSITIHQLVLPSSSDFDRKGTKASKHWETALLFVADQHGWSEAVYGRHLEQPERVLLLIGWDTKDSAIKFLRHGYANLVNLLSPILATSPPSIPEAAPMNLNVITPAGSGATTVYRNSFHTLTDEDQPHLLAATFYSYVQYLDTEDAGTEGYISFDAAWVVDLPSGKRTKQLYLMITWESLEAEQHSDATFKITDGRLTRNVLFKEPVLDKADDGGERFHVAWTMLSKFTLDTWKKSLLE